MDSNRSSSTCSIARGPNCRRMGPVGLWATACALSCSTSSSRDPAVWRSPRPPPSRKNMRVTTKRTGDAFIHSTHAAGLPVRSRNCMNDLPVSLRVTEGPTSSVDDAH